MKKDPVSSSKIFDSFQRVNLNQRQPSTKPIFGGLAESRSRTPANMNNLSQETSFLSCIDNDLKGEIRNQMQIMKSEVLKMYKRMVVELKNTNEIELIKTEEILKEKIGKSEILKEEFELMKTQLKVLEDKINKFDELLEQTNEKTTDLIKKYLEEVIEKKFNKSDYNYNQLKLEIESLETKLKEEFELKIQKLLENTSSDTFLSHLKENSQAFELKLKTSFEDLNSRIKATESKIDENSLKKEEFFRRMRFEFENKFKEGESYFQTQLTVFKNMLSLKIDQKEFKILMENALEQRLTELRSELSLTKGILNNHNEESKSLQIAVHEYLDRLDNEFNKISNGNNQKNNDFEKRIVGISNENNKLINVIKELEEKLKGLQGLREQFLRENQQKQENQKEIISKEISYLKEKSQNLEKNVEKIERNSDNLKNNTKFTKINQLELGLTQISSSISKSQAELGSLLEGLKTRLSVIESENNRLKDREEMLLKEIEENKKKNRFYQITNKENKENRSETTITNAQTHNKEEELNEILDGFEDYREENSILSENTENDVFFYPKQIENQENIENRKAFNRQTDEAGYLIDSKGNYIYDKFGNMLKNN